MEKRRSGIWHRTVCRELAAVSFKSPNRCSRNSTVNNETQACLSFTVELTTYQVIFNFLAGYHQSSYATCFGRSRGFCSPSAIFAFAPAILFFPFCRFIFHFPSTFRTLSMDLAAPYVSSPPECQGFELFPFLSISLPHRPRFPSLTRNSTGPCAKMHLLFFRIGQKVPRFESQ